MKRLFVVLSALACVGSLAAEIVTEDIEGGKALVVTGSAYTSDEAAALNANSVIELWVQGNASLTSKGIASYNGIIRVKSGCTFAIEDQTGLGTKSGATYIEDGATLLAKVKLTNTDEPVFLAGAGVGGTLGAWRSTVNPSTLSKVTLTDDATVTSTADGKTTIGGTFDMGGHTLTIAMGGSSLDMVLSSSQLNNPGPFVVRSGYLYLQRALEFGPEHTVTCCNEGAISLWNRNQHWESTVIVKNDGIDKSSSSRIFFGGGTWEGVSWDGPIVYEGNSQAKTFSYNVGNVSLDKKVLVEFKRNISGEGGFIGPDGRWQTPSICELQGTNTFTGTLAIPNYYSVWARATNSIPDLAKVTFGTGSALVLEAKSEANPDGFDGACLAKWWKDNAGVSGARMRVSAHAGTVTTLTDVDLDNKAYTLGGEGEGVVRLAASFDGTAATFDSPWNGLTLTKPADPSKPRTFKSFTVSGGVLTLDDFGLYDFGRTNVYIGGVLKTDSSTKPYLGFTNVAKVVVKEGTVLTQTPPMTSAKATSKLYLGSSANAVGLMEVLGGAVTNVPLMGTQGNALGGLFVRGGHFYSFAGEENDGPVGSAAGAEGYFEVTGGMLQIRGASQLGKAKGGKGLIYQKGGVVQLDGEILIGAAGTGIVYQTGGTFIAKATRHGIPSSFWNWGNDSGIGVQTVDGATATAQLAGMTLLGERKRNGLGILNLNNGGTWATTVIRKARYADYKKTAADRETNWKIESNAAYVNFDGGVLKAVQSGEMFVPPNDADYAPVDRISVYAKGAVVDTAGYNLTACQPLERPAGGGVTALDIPGGGSVGHYVVAPTVMIGGEGVGATAVADFDSASGLVKGVIVTSPGAGYKAGTTVAYIDRCGAVPNYTIPLAVTVSDPATTGGFTKRGAGTLTLTAANTYGGATVVEGGTLKLGVANALPQGSDLVVRGGTLAATSGVALPSTIQLDVSGYDFTNDKAKYTIVDLGTAENAPKIEFVNGTLPWGWEVVRRGQTLILRCQHGSVLLVR